VLQTTDFGKYNHHRAEKPRDSEDLDGKFGNP